MSRRVGRGGDLARIDDGVELDWDGEGRRLLVERVRPVLVVVRHVDAEHLPDMSMTEDQLPIHALPPKVPNHPRAAEIWSRTSKQYRPSSCILRIPMTCPSIRRSRLTMSWSLSCTGPLRLGLSRSQLAVPLLGISSPSVAAAVTCQSPCVRGPKDCYRPASRRKAKTLQEQRIQCHKKARA